MKMAINAQRDAEANRQKRRLRMGNTHGDSSSDSTDAKCCSRKWCRTRSCCCGPNASEANMSDIEIEAAHRRQEPEYYFDYNTVEATLLACGVLVCLAGVLFENDRFDKAAIEANPALAWQREFITYIIMGLILCSLVYYAVVFLSEVFGYTPKVIIECCRSRGRRLSEFAARRRTGYTGEERHLY